MRTLLVMLTVGIVSSLAATAYRRLTQRIDKKADAETVRAIRADLDAWAAAMRYEEAVSHS